MTACLSLHYHYVLWHFCLGMNRNKNFWMRKWPTSFGFRFFFVFCFCTFPFSPFLIFLLQWFPFYRACFQFKNFWEGVIDKGTFYHGIGTWSCRQCNFAQSFSPKFLSIFMDISGSTELFTLIMVSLERTLPSAELEYRWCQFRSMIMTSEGKQRLLVWVAFALHVTCDHTLLPCT